jgi:hypothetical protein
MSDIIAYKATEKNEQDDSPAGFEAKEAPVVVAARTN